LISASQARSHTVAALEPTQAPFPPGDARSLLLECLHLDPARPDRKALETLSPADWDQLVALAAQTAVSYQLYERVLQPRLRSVVPAEPLARLRAAVHEQTVRVIRLQATLVEILKACAAVDLPVIVLKGMHLAHTVYDSPVARDMVDIDLLFKRTDMPKATAVFKSLGYNIPHKADNLFDLSPANKEYTLAHPVLGTSVDVHWMLTKPQWEASIEETALWDRASTFYVAGERALGLAVEDQLAYICFHASYAHYFAFVGLRPFVDISRICANAPGTNWSTFEDRVHDWGWQRSAVLSLSIARRYLGACVPDEISADAIDSTFDLAHIQQAALTFVFLGGKTNDNFQVNMLRLLASRSFTDTLRLLVNRLFPPYGELIQEFGLSAGQKMPPLPLLHIRRISRMIRRHAPKLWHLRRAGPAQWTALDSQRRLIAWLAANQAD
jgi:hypothetical protein